VFAAIGLEHERAGAGSQAGANRRKTDKRESRKGDNPCGCDAA
jgi:hypothetical protein